MPMRTKRSPRLLKAEKGTQQPVRKLSPAKLATLAFNAGFGKELVEKGETLGEYLNPFNDPEKKVALGRVIELRDAVAIALAESGGVVKAVNSNTNGTVDRGLWQINSVHALFDGDKLLSDPAYNARAAFQVYQERAARGVNGFEAWPAFRNKSYLLHLQRARRGLKKAGFFSGSLDVPRGGNWATELDEKIQNPLEGIADKIANALWPVLLKTALAGTGLALIGFGVKSLFGSSAATASQKTAPVATGVANEVKS